MGRMIGTRLAAAVVLILSVVFLESDPAAAHGNRSWNLCNAVIHNHPYGAQRLASTASQGGCAQIGVRLETSTGWSSWCMTTTTYCSSSRGGTFIRSQHYLRGVGALFPPDKVYECWYADCSNPSFVEVSELPKDERPPGT